MERQIDVIIGRSASMGDSSSSCKTYAYLDTTSTSSPSKPNPLWMTLLPMGNESPWTIFASLEPTEVSHRGSRLFHDVGRGQTTSIDY